MLDLLMDAAVNTATGGLFGLIGTTIQAVLKGFSDRQQNKHELAMREMDMRVLETESQLRIKEIEGTTSAQIQVAELAMEAAEQEAAADIMKASYRADKATYGGGFVDGVRGLMRPLITVFLVVACFLITFQLWGLSQEIKPSPEEAWALYTHTVQQILFLAATAVTWWFGSRLMRNPGQK